MAMKKRLCALEDDRKFKDRKFEKFHAELIIRQQKCGKVDLKGLSRSQAEFLRREIWRKIEKQDEKNDELEAEPVRSMTSLAHISSTKQANV